MDKKVAAIKLKQLLQLLQQEGITDATVIAAMQQVPRHLFVPQSQQHLSYENIALPIGYQQTISQPFIVAFMSQVLLGGRKKLKRVLEVGTGSGYQVAILAQFCKQVISVERVPQLFAAVSDKLAELNINNVELIAGDGVRVATAMAPFDGIIVTAAAREIPAALVTALADGGALIIPVGDRVSQELILIERHGDSYSETALLPVIFVPLITEDDI